MSFILSTDLGNKAAAQRTVKILKIKGVEESLSFFFI